MTPIPPQLSPKGNIGFLVFEGFPPTKIASFAPMMLATFDAIRKVVAGPGSLVLWPWRIRAMTRKEIREGRRTGHGHGLYYPPPEGRPGWEADVAINASMPSWAIYLNVIHELAHHANPMLTDKQINDIVVPKVFKLVTGKSLDKTSWKNYRGTNPK